MLGTHIGPLTELGLDDEDEDCVVILLGTWRAMRGAGTIRSHGVRFDHCPTVDLMPSLVNASRAGWILAALDFPEGEGDSGGSTAGNTRAAA